MKTFDTFREKFLQNKKPYWKLSQKGRVLASSTSDYLQKDERSDEDKINESLEELEAALSLEGDGIYDIWFAKNSKAGQGKLSDTFIFGEQKTTEKAERRTDAAQGVGIAGLNSLQGLQFLMGLTNQNNGELERLRAENAKLLLEKQRIEIEQSFEKKIAGIQSESGASEGWGDVIKGIVTSYFPEILDRVAAPKTAIVAATSSRANRKILDDTAILDDEEINEDTEGDTESTADSAEMQKRLYAVFAALQNDFPEHNPIEVLEALISMFKKFGTTVKPMILKELNK